MPHRPLGPGAYFSFELTGNHGAALVTKYPTFGKDSLLEFSFEEYTKRHYESWVKFARHKMYGRDVQPILVYGFDMTRDFAMVAYSNEGTSLEADLTITVPMIASASASTWGTWRTRCTPHTKYWPHQYSHPSSERAIGLPPSQPVDAMSIPDEFDQCVFVRYYTMRWRWRFPRVIRAGAGPHDLGPGNNEGDTFPELTVQSDAGPATSDDEDLRGQWGPTTDDADSDPGAVIRNIPYVRVSPCHFVPADVCLQDEEYDSWGAIADYVFQVIPFPRRHRKVTQSLQWKNSDAVSVLMHHRDLAGIRMVRSVTSDSQYSFWKGRRYRRLTRIISQV